jgi:hypothetical protein
MDRTVPGTGSATVGAMEMILLATGAGLLAIAIMGVALYFTLGAEDRSKLGVLLRHPVKAIFTEDEPDPDDW